MSVIKSAALVAIIAAATTFAYGNTATSIQPEGSLEFRQSTGQGDIVRLPMAVSQEGGAFRSTLREVSTVASGRLVTDRGDLRAAEPAHEQVQDNPLPLPEPSAGTLMMIGAFAVFASGWRNALLLGKSVGRNN